MRCEVKRILYSVCTISLLSSSLLAVDIKSPTDAVNIAGKQRMYTQRMLKDYAMVGMKNTFGKPSEDLKNTIENFDDAMVSLGSYTKSEDTKSSLKKVEALWLPLKKILLVEPSKESVAKLQEDLDALLKLSDDTTKLFAKESGKASGDVVNMAGRQRMLSQRMAGLYMLQVWGVEDPKFKEKLNESMDLFKTSLDTLEASTLNSKDISSILSKVKRSFMFFEMMGRGTSKFVPTLIYKKSNDILNNMNTATQAYVALETK